MLGKCVAHPLVNNGTATEREHLRLTGGEQLERHPLFGRSESRLSVLREHRGDRFTQPLLEDLVDVERVCAERPRDAAGSGRLPGAHETDAYDRATGC